jgi:hypothetical protein
VAALEGPVKAGNVTWHQLKRQPLILLQAAEAGLGLGEAFS